MAFTALTAGQVDAKSPVSDDWTDLIRTNLDHLYSMTTDGVSAPEGLVVDTLQVANAGASAFDVTGDGQIDGNFNVDGTFTVGQFVSSDQLLWFSGF